MRLAHITEKNGQRVEQSLKEHCLVTAKYAKESLESIGFGETAYISGLLHDMGKGTKAFNEYLEKSYNQEAVKRGTVNHSFAGVIYILEKYHDTNNREQKITSELIAYAIGAHHGLFDAVSIDDKNGFLYRLTKDKDEIHYKEAIEYYFENVESEERIGAYFQRAVMEVKIFLDKMSSLDFKVDRFMMIGFLARLILSAVIYGDRRDTRQFMTQKDDPIFKIDWEQEREFLENSLSSFDTNSFLNKVRSEISQQCSGNAELESGIYKLRVPTGGGKTLSSLKYALTHAQIKSKKRIIFAIPLLSILDQNSKVIKENIQNPKCVLEHHSNVIHEKNKEEELDQYELLTDTWRNPIIITTLVQLLNTLFAGKTSEIGRFQALSDSIIVIDEIQTLPTKTINMFNCIVNFLSLFCNTTIVLSSATQPSLGSTLYPIRYAKDADLVKLSSMQLEAFKRAKIINCVTPYGLSLGELADFANRLIDKHKALLLICNTKKEARDTFDLMKNRLSEEHYEIFHLSTSMCKAHRAENLKRIIDGLEKIQKDSAERKIICISTQLVEAGIDFSFDAVIRVLAGIDNLAQAAGRSNRSNEYEGGGTVYLVNLKDESLGMLTDIQAAQNATRMVLAAGYENLDNEAATDLFFHHKFNELRYEMNYPISVNGNTYELGKLVGKNPFLNTRENKKFFLTQPFKLMGQKFKVFDNDTVDVLVPYGDGVELIQQLRNLHECKAPIGAAYSILDNTKEFTISLWRYEIEAIGSWIETLFDERVYILPENMYDIDCGFYKEVLEQPMIF